MSIRWGSRAGTTGGNTVVEFKETVHQESAAKEAHMFARMDEMSRLVEDVQRRNEALETRLAAQNDTVRDQTLSKLVAIESKMGGERASSGGDHSVLRKLTALETRLAQPLEQVVSRIDQNDRRTIEGSRERTETEKQQQALLNQRLERIECRLEQPLRLSTEDASQRTLEMLERLEGKAQTLGTKLAIPADDGAQVEDRWLQERSRLHQLRGAVKRMGGR